MKLVEMYPPKYLRGKELFETPRIAMITGVEKGEVWLPQRKRNVERYLLCIKGTEQKVILSREVASSVQQALGLDDTADWIGKMVVLFSTRAIIAGKEKFPVRARALTKEEQEKFGGTD